MGPSGVFILRSTGLWKLDENRCTGLVQSQEGPVRSSKQEMRPSLMVTELQPSCRNSASELSSGSGLCGSPHCVTSRAKDQTSKHEGDEKLKQITCASHHSIHLTLREPRYGWPIPPMDSEERRHVHVNLEAGLPEAVCGEHQLLQ